jgi:hypothetical protein
VVPRPLVVAAALARRRGQRVAAHRVDERAAARARDALEVGVVHLQHRRGAARAEALDELQREAALGVGLAVDEVELLLEEVGELVGAGERARERPADLQVVAADRGARGTCRRSSSRP